MNKYYDIKKLIENKDKIFRFKLNLQNFAEEEKKVDETETIKVLKEEYEKKLNDQKQEYEKKISEINTNHINQIKALVSGRSENLNDETRKLQNENKELSFEEQLLKDTRKELGLKEEN